MSWILQNKFLAALMAITISMSGAFLFFGSKASARYQQHKEDFDRASAQVASYERLALYPNQENLDAKKKALSDYESSIKELKGFFAAFVHEQDEGITPQEFGNRLIEANGRIKNRLQRANIALPDSFYSGFEAYTGQLAQSGATKVLNHQLAIIDALMADLAEARPVELVNFRREPKPEETGRAYEVGADDVVRPHSFELTFTGTEASARRFITSLVDTGKRFAVIRLIRITNESTVAPRPSANLFTAPVVPGRGGAANPFAGAFFDAFGDNAEPGEPGDEDEPGDAAPIAPALPQPAAPASAGARRLGQVAGNEMIRVFIRFDVMEVLPDAIPTIVDES